MVGFRRRARSLPTFGSSPSLGGLDQALGTIAAARLAAPFDVGRLPITVASRLLIADTIAQLPLVRLRDGVQLDAGTILRQPNPDEPLSVTLHRLAWALTDPGANGGNAFALVSAWNAAGLPLAVLPVWPHEVAAVPDDLRRVVAFEWNGRTWDTATMRWSPMILDPSCAPLGTSPLRLAADALSVVGAAYRFAASYFTEGGAPRVGFDLGPYGTPAQAKEMRDAWDTDHAGRAGPTFTWGGTTISNYGSTAVDAALVDVLNWGTAEVARTVLMAPSLVNAATASPMTYATVVDEARRWLRFGLGGYLTRLEALFTGLLPRGQVARFDTSELLRTDWAEQIAGWVQLVSNNIADARTAADALNVTPAPPRAAGITDPGAPTPSPLPEGTTP